MNIIKHKNIYFLISGILIIPGLFFLFFSGLKLAVDFTGGSVGEYQISKKVSESELRKTVTGGNVEVHSVRISDGELILRTNALTQKEHDVLLKKLKNKFTGIKEKSFETVGPVIGSETALNALKAVGIASIAILLYIAFVFRKVSKPVASWKYGVCAIIALLHDVLFVVGVFAILGYFFHVEVDSLFITALLTVMGFSVHDTIVVFDRIRENLRKDTHSSYEVIVNNSILQTMNRSLNTSITIILVLFLLFLFGGESTRWFIVALLLGILSGTFSSIFNASPLLVLWYEFDKKRAKGHN